METLTLTDTAISHIAKLVQVAILTGTDIVDNLRMAEFINSDGQLDISPEYHESFNDNITRMMTEAVEANAENAAKNEDEWVTVNIPQAAVGPITQIKITPADEEE